jgi:ABC-type bacteriocin/lantibiotic exporter with double-glycine peptidase domain
MVLQNRSVSIGIVVCHCHAANKKKRQENGSWKIAVYFFLRFMHKKILLYYFFVSFFCKILVVIKW